MDNILLENCHICYRNPKVIDHSYCETCMRRFFPAIKFTVREIKKKVKKVENNLPPLT